MVSHLFHNQMKQENYEQSPKHHPDQCPQLPRCLVTPRAIEFIVACVVAALVYNGGDSNDREMQFLIVPAKI